MCILDNIIKRALSCVNALFSLLYHPRRLFEGLSAAAFFFMVTVIFTWPLARHFAGAIPAGSEPAGLANFHFFMARWTGMVMEQGRSYWHTPFFYPFSGTLAWTESEPLTCLLIWLISKVTGYYAAYNSVVMVYLTGFGLSGYAAVRLCTRDRVAALLAGIWLTAGAYSLQQICALNLISGIFPCGCLFFLFWYARNRRALLYWCALGLYICTWLSSKQSAYFLSLLIPAAILPFLSLRIPSRGALARMAVSCVVIAAAVAPYAAQALPYIRAMGFERTIDNISAVFSLKRLIMPAHGHWLATRILGWQVNSWDLGIIALVLTAAAVLCGIFRKNALDGYARKLAAGTTLMALVSIILGFGPRLGIVLGDTTYGLYTFLFSVVPGFNIIRAPARFGLFASFGIAVLAAISFAFLRGRIKGRAGRRVFSGAVFVFLFAEMWVGPVRLSFPDNEIRGHREVVDWLKKNGAGNPVVELPIAPGGNRMNEDAGAMLRMLEHGNPVINGYAGFTPVPFRQLRLVLGSDPQEKGRRFLDAYGARWCLLHKDRLSAGQQGAWAALLGETSVYEDARHAVYSLPGQPGAQDIAGLIPSGIPFGDRPPRAGAAYAVRLSRAPAQATLVMPREGWYLKASWIDAAGRQSAGDIRLRGSVILDEGQEKLYFRIMRLPRGGRPGEARLIAADDESTRR